MRKWNALSDVEKNSLVGSFVRLMLLKHRDRARVLPSDISKYVLVGEFQGLKVREELQRKASEMLLDLFGLELVEEQKMLFLRNTLPMDDPYEEMQWDDPDPIHGLSALLIGMLHTSRTGRLERDELFNALLPLGFRPDVPHPVFGKWEDVIDRKICVEQRYFVQKKSKDDHGDLTIHYEAGPRLAVEASLEKTEAFVSAVYGRQVDPDRIKELQTERGHLEANRKKKKSDEAAATPSSSSKRGGATKKAPTRANSRRQSRAQFSDDDE